MTKKSFDALDDFVIQVLGIFKSKSDNRLWKFNIADQKLKNRTIFKFLICYIGSPMLTFKVLSLNLVSAPPETVR